MTQSTIIFLHIPKTAGSTLYRILERQYSPATFYTIDWVSHTVDDFKKLSESQWAHIRLLTGHVDFGLHTRLPGPSTYFTLLRGPIDLAVSYYFTFEVSARIHFTMCCAME